MEMNYKMPRELLELELFSLEKAMAKATRMLEPNEVYKVRKNIRPKIKAYKEAIKILKANEAIFV